MEQRKDPTVPLVHAAGTDPAYIPGLTPPQAVQPAAEQAAEPEQPPVVESEDAAPEETPAAPAEPKADAEPGPDFDEADFEVSDQRGSIAAGLAGISFRLDGEEARFRWAEIGAVEIGAPRFGRRFAVTVYTTDKRRYEADVAAPLLGGLKKWTAEFDAVLDAHFEE